MPVTEAKNRQVHLQQFTGTAESVSSEQDLDFEWVEENIPSYQVYVVLDSLKDRGVRSVEGTGHARTKASLSD